MVKKVVCTILILLCSWSLSLAQDKKLSFDSVDTDTSNIYSIDVNINLFNKHCDEDGLNLVEVNPSDVNLTGSQSTADLLQNTGNVFVQKSQMGGGSPILRGLEGNKILLMVDGIKLNNMITRGGHTQSSVLVDNLLVENIEILYSSANVKYGSEALGGVINFKTKDADIRSDSFALDQVNVLSRYSSANNGSTYHVDLAYGSKKLNFISSLSYNRFDDLLTGKKETKNYADWGLRENYVDRINNRDSIVDNNNPSLQVGTGYNQINFVQKSKWQISNKTK